MKLKGKDHKRIKFRSLKLEAFLVVILCFRTNFSCALDGFGLKCVGLLFSPVRLQVDLLSICELMKVPIGYIGLEVKVLENNNKTMRTIMAAHTTTS